MYAFLVGGGDFWSLRQLNLHNLRDHGCQVQHGFALGRLLPGSQVQYRLIEILQSWGAGFQHEGSKYACKGQSPPSWKLEKGYGWARHTCNLHVPILWQTTRQTTTTQQNTTSDAVNYYIENTTEYSKITRYSNFTWCSDFTCCTFFSTTGSLGQGAKSV